MNEKEIRCPNCGRTQPESVLTCDCGYSFSKPEPPLAEMLLPIPVVILLALVIGSIGYTTLNSLGVIWICIGFTILMGGKERIWRLTRWQQSLRGIEAQRTAGWDALYYLGIILFFCWGAIRIGLDFIQR